MWTCEHKLAMSGQTDSQVGAGSTEVAKNPFHWAFHARPYKGKQYWDQLASTCVWWPNGEKLAFACVQIWARSKWTQVIAGLRKYTQVMAKRSRKLTDASFQLAITCDSDSRLSGQGFSSNLVFCHSKLSVAKRANNVWGAHMTFLAYYRWKLWGDNLRRRPNSVTDWLSFPARASLSLLAEVAKRSNICS